MTTRKCDLCKEAAFVAVEAGYMPFDWEWVEVYGIPPTKLLICPFCCAVARAFQRKDRQPLPLELDRQPHPVKRTASEAKKRGPILPDTML